MGNNTRIAGSSLASGPSGANLNPYAAIGGGVQYVTGLVNDPTGTVDNTPALAAAAASLGPLGGLLNIPAGTFPANWTIPTNVTAYCSGSGAASAAPVTHFIGLTALAGIQQAPISVTNNNSGLVACTVDGGTGCLNGILITGNDPYIVDVQAIGGTQVAWNHQPTSLRGNFEYITTNQAPTSFINRTTTGTASGSSGSTTYNDTSANFTAADQYRQIQNSAGAIPLGTTIVTVVSSTQVVLDQALIAAASGTTTIYWYDSAWIFGQDAQYNGNCRFKQGVKRIGSSAGGLQMENIHCTFTTQTGATGLCNVLLEGDVEIDNLYLDSCNDSTGCPLVHKVNGAGAHGTIGTFRGFQNSAGVQTPFFTENDTASSVTFGVGHFNGVSSAKAFTCFANLVGGNNPNLSCEMLHATSSNLQATSGIPNILSSSNGQQSGTIKVNYGGTTYGAGVTAVSVSTPSSGTATQNPYGVPLTLACTATTTSAAGTSSLKVGQTSGGSFTTTSTFTPGTSGAVGMMYMTIPPGWYYKITYSNCTDTLEGFI